MSKLVSIIVPVHNEQDNLKQLYQALNSQFKQIGLDFDFEILLINDGSNDNSQQIIDELSKLDHRVKSIEFARNFGKEIATTAGLNNCHGDSAIMIDADLQHPVEMIPEFLDKWQLGADIVIGLRKNGKRKGIIKKIGSLVFYQLMNIFGETKISAKATDYRLIDRKVINEFNRFTERNRITRGLLDWLGFKKDYVYFDPNPRFKGEATYSKLKLIKLALTAFVSHSLFPLRVAGYLGILIITFSGPLGLFIFLDRYIFNDITGYNFSGPAILAVLNLFMTGIILSCLGLIALYIGNIQNETTNRPLYVVREKKNFEKNNI